mmetsp:Transcript_21476/g.38575  ORF Transcript_21476/g.38575 Transcript_21476/m.38575 type:complete len:411 (-) Transcript_21476:1-1233(-)
MDIAGRVMAEDLGEEFRLQQRRELLSDLESVHSNADGCETLRSTWGARDDVRSRPFLKSHIVVVLQEKVRHPVGIRCLPGGDPLLELLVRSHRAELFHAIDLDDCHGVAAAAPVRLDRHRFARSRGDGEADAREVGVVTERQALGIFLIGHDRLDGLGGDAVVGHEQSKLVHGHVLQHPLGVALEALRKLVTGVRVVVDEGGDRAGGLGLELARQGHVLGHVFVVSHVDFDPLLRSVRCHLLKLAHRWGAGLLQEDVGAAFGDDILEQLWIVRGAARDKCELLAGSLRHIIDRGVERHARVLVLERAELLPGVTVSTSAKEPRLDHIRQVGAGHVAVDHLLGVVPAHAAFGHPAADEHDVALRRHGARRHGARDSNLAAKSRGRKTRQHRVSLYDVRGYGDQARTHARLS